jgi:hypothetical protein
VRSESSKLIGTAPLQFINKRRIEKAQEILLGTDETLYEVTQQMGLTMNIISHGYLKAHDIFSDLYRKEKYIHHRR